MIDEKNDNKELETARIGFFDKYDVYIVTDDRGVIPHFHIRDVETKGDKFHTSIMIENAEYFYHNNNENILSKKDICKMIDFFKEKYRYNKNWSKWEQLIALWNDNNMINHLDINVKMPDYTKLQNNKKQ